MRYATPGAFRTALEQRLLTAAHEATLPVVRLRKLVVFERLLARLLVVAPDQWLLKGALALDLRLGGRSRTTKDMDLARYDDDEAATTDLLAAQAVDLGDYFTFAIERTGRLEVALEGAAVRYHVAAALDGRPFEDVIVDIGFADPIATVPETLQGPDLLRFAAIAPIAVPIAQHVAEKAHAYTRMYAGERRSSRVKDLIDLVLIRFAIAFEADRIQGALRATFAQRGTHPLPAALPLPPADWDPRIAGWHARSGSIPISVPVSRSPQRSSIRFLPGRCRIAPGGIRCLAHGKSQSNRSVTKKQQVA